VEDRLAPTPGPDPTEVSEMTSTERPWRPDLLLRVLLGWTSLTMLLGWLPFIRTPMDGATYTWGVAWWGMAAGGTGLTLQYWVPVVTVALGVAIVALGCRGARAPFPWLLLGWHAALFSNFTHMALTSPESFRFQGDTAGIDFSLAWVGPLLTGAFLAAALFWVVRDRRKGGAHVPPAWGRVNTVWLGALIALLPVQFVLLRFGEPHGTTDLVGVIITIVQWMLLPTALRPRLR
jgi:hypothetical protein